MKSFINRPSMSSTSIREMNTIMAVVVSQHTSVHINGNAMGKTRTMCTVAISVWVKNTAVYKMSCCCHGMVIPMSRRRGMRKIKNRKLPSTSNFQNSLTPCPFKIPKREQASNHVITVTATGIFFIFLITSTDVWAMSIWHLGDFG